MATCRHLNCICKMQMEQCEVLGAMLNAVIGSVKINMLLLEAIMPGESGWQVGYQT